MILRTSFFTRYPVDGIFYLWSKIAENILGISPIGYPSSGWNRMLVALPN